MVDATDAGSLCDNDNMANVIRGPAQVRGSGGPLGSRSRSGETQISALIGFLKKNKL